MSTRRKRRRLRMDRVAVVLVLLAILIAGLGFGVYKVTALLLGPEPVASTDKDKTSDAYSTSHAKQVEEIKKGHVLDTVNTTGFTDSEVRSLFYSQEIPEDVLSHMEGVTYSADQDFIKIEDLRYIRVLYKDFSNTSVIGELVANKSIANDLEEIFYDLYNHDYQIGRMILPNTYKGNREASMADNNTSAFNMFLSEGITRSATAMGLAVDLNPLYNPQVVTSKDGMVTCYPSAGYDYMDRSNIRTHMIDTSDYAYKVFTKYGFSWGGANGQTDYMRFEKGYTAAAEPQEQSDEEDQAAQSDEQEETAAEASDQEYTEDQTEEEYYEDEPVIDEGEYIEETPDYTEEDVWSDYGLQPEEESQPEDCYDEEGNWYAC